MFYLYTTILAAYLIVLIISRKEEEKGPFRKMAAYVLRRQQSLQRFLAKGRHNWKRDLNRRQLEEKFRILQPSVAVNQQVRDHYITQYSLMLIVLFLGDLICLAVWISAHSNPLLMNGSTIERNPNGQGDIPIELSAQIVGEEEEIFDYLVEERVYTKQEAEALYEQAVNVLEDVIRGENESLEDVRRDLQLVTTLDGYPFEISWESSCYALVNVDGTVDNRNLTDGEIGLFRKQTVVIHGYGLLFRDIVILGVFIIS